MSSDTQKSVSNQLMSKNINYMPEEFEGNISGEFEKVNSLDVYGVFVVFMLTQSKNSVIRRSKTQSHMQSHIKYCIHRSTYVKTGNSCVCSCGIVSHSKTFTAYYSLLIYFVYASVHSMQHIFFSPSSRIKWALTIYSLKCTFFMFSSVISVNVNDEN